MDIGDEVFVYPQARSVRDYQGLRGEIISLHYVGLDLKTVTVSILWDMEFTLTFTLLAEEVQPTTN